MAWCVDRNTKHFLNKNREEMIHVQESERGGAVGVWESESLANIVVHVGELMAKWRKWCRRWNGSKWKYNGICVCMYAKCVHASWYWCLCLTASVCHIATAMTATTTRAVAQSSVEKVEFSDALQQQQRNSKQNNSAATSTQRNFS